VSVGWGLFVALLFNPISKQNYFGHMTNKTFNRHSNSDKNETTNVTKKQNV
jgi:hypothetical protein